MNFAAKHIDHDRRNRQKSAVITLLTAILGFLLIYFYKFTKITETPEEVTTMLLNFGDSRNGQDSEDPAFQQGSLAAETAPETQPVQPDVSQSQPAAEVQPEPVKTQRVITGTNTKVTAARDLKATKPVSKTTAKAVTKPSNSKTASSKATVSNSKTGSGDGKGTAAIGNLIGGRKSNAGTQGTAGTTGNAGDPLGGDSDGDSKIGVDRNLIGFIPGTMGRGGAQPSHNCTASGTINISYTVDKAGNVTLARRSGGISDACAVSTSISWVKRYVKAERANTSSTGTYTISF